MVGLSDLNSLQCHEGLFSESDFWKQTQFDTDYIYLIVFIIGLGFSLWNNSLALELFIRCMNCGIYLIVKCFTSG
jgi:hypothetical protein